MVLQSKNKGFSLVELIVVIAILVVFAAVLIPSLLQYTENSRAQKDESAMDEVVNAVQLALADQDCFDEMLQYSCTNNFVTYSDSTGDYASQAIDGEFWAPDGAGRATTITFNPETGSNNATIYRMDSAIINDMTYGNGSVAHGRVMEGSLIENNQCYLKNASLNGNQTGYLYNRVRQTIGDSVTSTSQTYRNSSFTVFIRFTQKDGVTVADVSGQFNGTNLYEGAPAAIGSGTTEYEQETGAPIVSVTTPGKQESNYTASDLMGSVTLSGGNDYKENDRINIKEGAIIPEGGVYYVKCNYQNRKIGQYDNCAQKLVAGDYFPELSWGDVFVYGDYEYQYHYYCSSGGWLNNTAGRENSDGWGVVAIDKTKSHYGTILSYINNRPVMNMSMTFYSCKNMTISPQIPETVLNIDYAYALTSITHAPNIPDSVTVSTSAFAGCDKLEIGPKYVSKNLTNTSAMFRSCKNLKIAPDFSHCDKLTNMHTTYYGCKNLITYHGNKNGNGNFSNYALPINLSIASELFAYCEKITHAPQLPNKVTNISGMFVYNISLQSATIVPSSVTNMQAAFNDCVKLNGIVVINSTPTKYENCFTNINFANQNLTLMGSSTILDTIGATGKNYCADCNGACNSSH